MNKLIDLLMLTYISVFNGGSLGSPSVEFIGFGTQQDGAQLKCLLEMVKSQPWATKLMVMILPCLVSEPVSVPFKYYPPAVDKVFM